jgi:hypothetical protein
MSDKNLSIRFGLQNNLKAAEATFGDMNWLNSGKNWETLRQKVPGMFPQGAKAADYAPEFNGVMKDLTGLSEREWSGMVSAIPKEVRKLLEGVEPNSERAWKIIEEARLSGKQLSNFELPPGLLSREVFENQAYIKMLRYIKDKAKENPNGITWKALEHVLTKTAAGYENYDQTSKMATFLRSTLDGYTEAQMKRVRRLIDISPEEIIRGTSEDGLQIRYKLPVDRALELSNVVYLNYSAMPNAVRVLRGLPLVGSPFISFMYGMALKTGQTMVYNPSAFNKIGFAMNDFGGQKTPLEKSAIKEPDGFYGYLERPGMFRVPGEGFFDTYPIYANLANVLPYFSLNMFNPSESSFNSNSLPTKFIERVQRSPFVKDPVGAILFDYLVQPMILDEAINPQGQFGQALYPTDAGLGTKAAYGVRSLGEAFFPNIAAIGGLAQGAVAPGLTPYMPSYRWRSMANAIQGLNQVGISGKESAPSRTVRNISSYLGLPIQPPMDLNYAKKKVKK